MRGFAAGVAEPLVGEIRAVRGFNVSDDGRLFPIGRAGAPWTAGVNTARCLLNAGHHAPDPTCRCGFYAYLDIAWARHGAVLAIVSAWGDTIIGTRGVRAQYARIEAVCLPPNVAGTVRDAVRARYPGIMIFDRADEMTTRLPPSRLPGVRRPIVRGIPAPSPAGRWAVHLAVAAALLALPVIDWTSSLDLRGLRLVLELLALVLGAATLRNTLTRRGWGPTFSIRLGAWLGLLALPLLIGPPDSARTIGFGAAMLLLVAGFVRSWREREPPVQVIPTTALREALLDRRRSDWSTTTRRDRTSTTAVTRSADGLWGVQYVAIDPPSPSRSPRMASLRVGMPQYLELLRAAGRPGSVACLLDWRPSSGWVQVIPNTRVGLTRYTFAMSVDDLCSTLGLPPQAVGRESVEAPREWLTGDAS